MAASIHEGEEEGQHLITFLVLPSAAVGLLFIIYRVVAF